MSRLRDGAIVIGVIGLLVLSGSDNAGGSAKVIRAEKFVLVDEKGRELGDLSNIGLSLRDSAASIHLSDSSRDDPFMRGPAKKTVSIELQSLLPRFTVHDANGTTVMTSGMLYVTRFGSGVCLMSTSEAAGVYVHGKDCKERVVIEVDSEQRSQVVVGRNGEPQAILGSALLRNQKTGTVTERSPASLVLFGKDGKIVEQLPRD